MTENGIYEKWLDTFKQSHILRKSEPISKSRKYKNSVFKQKYRFGLIEISFSFWALLHGFSVSTALLLLEALLFAIKSLLNFVKKRGKINSYSRKSFCIEKKTSKSSELQKNSTKMQQFSKNNAAKSNEATV